MDPIDLFEKLKRIPFLKLGEVSNLDALIEELNEQKDKVNFYPFMGGPGIQMGSDLSALYEQLKTGNGTTSVDLIENAYAITSGGKNPKFELRDTGIKCPVMRQTTDDLVDTPGAVRISRMQGRATLMPMHRHYYIDKIPYCTELAIHIPLVTNKKVLSQIQGPDGKIYRQHFGIGEIWALNTYHKHNTINLSSETRYHLWINCYLTHPDRTPMNLKLAQIIEDSVNNYDGPLIDVTQYDEANRALIN